MPGVASGADGVLQRLTGGDHFAAVIMTAMTAHMMRTFQLAAIAAFGVRFRGQSLVAATHAPARGRRLTFRNSHGAESF